MNSTQIAGSGSSLLRRIAAITYDSMLLFAVLFFATLPLVILTGGGLSDHKFTYQIYLLGICFLYYGWQWTHGGQTLGMKAWRLRVVTASGAPVTWKDAGLRFAAAIPSLLAGGLGFLWVAFDRQRLAWHDRLSATRLILLPRHQDHSV